MSQNGEVNTLEQSSPIDLVPATSSRNWRSTAVSLLKRVALLFVAIVISLYLLELVLVFFPELSSNDKNELIEFRTRQRGLPFDGRSRAEAVRDLRKTDANWHPSISPTNFIGGKSLMIAGTPVVPLGGVSNANILYCNESGQYSTYTSDEYGFHNPVNIWPNSKKLSNVFVGDSFTNGSCVMPGEGFVDRTRAVYPNTINLAATGNGPLSELAGIQEYLRGKDLGYVFWVYFEGNDLSDLHNKEIKDPILTRYLNENDYSQGLNSDQAAVDTALIQYINDQLLEVKEDPKASRFWHHLMLQGTKMALFKLKNSMIEVDAPDYKLDMFNSILEKAKSNVEKNGGRLVFIYLPDYARYHGNKITKGSAAYMKDDVIGAVKNMGVDVIDVDRAFSQLDDPKSVFTFGQPNHYNSGGNLIIAGEILRYLNSRQDKGD